MSKIDVHHHFYPNSFTEALKRAGGDPSGWTVPPWTLEADQQINSDIGVQTALLTVTTPGPGIEKDPVAAAELARTSNESAAALRDAHPNSYGFLASLSDLTDTQASLSEIAYAFDVLNADRVMLFTRYGNDNHYLGHEDFSPIWTELNRRKAVILVHPTHGVDTNLVNSDLPQPMIDFPHETGCTAMDLILSGTLRSVQQCKIILSHAGGTLPYLIYRPAGMLPYTSFGVGTSTEELVEAARDFYFDTALSANPLTLDLLTKFARPGHVLFGSDFPNAPRQGIEYFTRNLAAYELRDETRREIEYESALRLFPRLKEGWSSRT